MIRPKVFIYSALAAIALFGTFIFGVHVGAYQSWLMDSSAKAAVLVHDLKVMRSGNTMKLIEVKEVTLDGEILQALRYQEEGHPWLLFPFSESYNHKNYLRTVALYRKNYPSPTPNLNLGGTEELNKEMQDYQVEVKNKTQYLLKQYGE